LLLWPRELGQAKVENLYPPVFSEEDVFRLKITVNNAGVMRCRQPSRDIRAHVEHFAQAYGATAQTVPQALAVKKLGNDVRRPVVLADLEDGNDVDGSGRLPGPPAQTCAVDRDLVTSRLEAL
jgi:hypothetical protein